MAICTRGNDLEAASIRRTLRRSRAPAVIDADPVVALLPQPNEVSFRGDARIHYHGRMEPVRTALRAQPRVGVRQRSRAAINLISALRILLMTLLGREHPDLPPKVMFSELEIKVLNAFAAQQGLDAHDTVASAVLIVARTGGYIHRARAPPPGTRVMWRGCTTVAGTCLGFTLAMEQKA